MKAQLNNVYRTLLYREVSKGKPKHLRLILLNALKQELIAGTDIVWTTYSLKRMCVWSSSELGFDFWYNLEDKFNSEELNG